MLERWEREIHKELLLHRENLVLYNVLNNEVIFEEYFCNLLQFNEFRNSFITFIDPENKLFNKEIIGYKNFNTEVVLENEKYGRADLFLNYNKKEYIFEIKNKCSTKLTDNQPKGYLEYLNNKNEQLYFLIPRFYSHNNEIIKRWKEYNNFDDVERKILYWEDFIKKLRYENLDNYNVEIKLFYEFCLYWLDMRPIIFKNKEKKMLTNTKIPRTIQKLFKITDGVLNHNIEYLRNEDTQNKDWYGYIIDNKKYKINNNYEIWFGVDYEIWSERNYPLTIQIFSEENSILEKISKLPINDMQKFEYKNGMITYFIPFGKISIEQNDEYIVENFAKEINNIIKILNSNSVP